MQNSCTTTAGHCTHNFRLLVFSPIVSGGPWTWDHWSNVKQLYCHCWKLYKDAILLPFSLIANGSWIQTLRIIGLLYQLCYHCWPLYIQFRLLVFSPIVRDGWIQTLELRIIGQLLYQLCYHCWLLHKMLYYCHFHPLPAASGYKPLNFGSLVNYSTSCATTDGNCILLAELL